MSDKWLALMWVGIVGAIAVMAAIVAINAQEGYKLWVSEMAHRGGAELCSNGDVRIVQYDQ